MPCRVRHEETKIILIRIFSNRILIKFYLNKDVSIDIANSNIDYKLYIDTAFDSDESVFKMVLIQGAYKGRTPILKQNYRVAFIVTILHIATEFTSMVFVIYYFLDKSVFLMLF